MHFCFIAMILVGDCLVGVLLGRGWWWCVCVCGGGGGGKGGGVSV